MPTFRTTLLSTGGNNVGIEIPDDVLAELGGKRVPVLVTIDGAYTYSSTTGVMGGRALVGVNAAHRAASGVAAGQEVEVGLERDTSERTVDLPPALAQALAADPAATAAWEALSPSRRKEHARSVADAKGDDTRQRRLDKVLAALRG